MVGLTISESAYRKLRLVAPALRGLVGDGKVLPLVQLDLSLGRLDCQLQVRIDDGLGPDGLVDAIHSKLADKTTRSVWVEDLGGLRIIPIPDAIRGRVAGKIALVTGAARGFGLEISQDLCSQGAYVVLTDVNEPGVVEAAAGLCRQYGQDRAIGLAMDVTDLESVERVAGHVISKFGGLDILISNAGVLKAGSVKTQPVKDFDLVTAVNYKGFFVCVQAFAPIMAIQHMANRAYQSDIIQINSKSGLVGSNRNAAYAGSKFGSIGLVQSFALELVEDGIKVNAVCPGNFFDGPLWSDPKDGLFVQYLRAGKVPGAKTIEDVRRAYEAKIPMGRGCTTADVMKAIYYLIEQSYETGQALPVTGGQVMLH